MMRHGFVMPPDERLRRRFHPSSVDARADFYPETGRSTLGNLVRGSPVHCTRGLPSSGIEAKVSEFYGAERLVRVTDGCK